MALSRGKALHQPILSPETEIKLIRAWKDDKDEKALERIVLAYYRLCYSIASQFTKDEVRMEDLAQEGVFGIIRALKKFDPEMGVKFSTYCRHWLQNFCAIAASNTLNDITVPSRVYLDAKMGRLTQSENENAINAVKPFIYLDAPIKDDSGNSILDTFYTDDETPEATVSRHDGENELKRVIQLAMSKLSKREADIILRRKLTENPDTLDDIAATYKLTRERIRQIEMGAMEKLKAALIKSGFDPMAFLKN